MDSVPRRSYYVGIGVSKARLDVPLLPLGDSFAAMLILLAVVNEGLGACFVGSFYDEEVQQVLGLPQYVRPIGIIPIGYCAEGPKEFPRRSKAQIVHRDRYRSG